MPQWDVTRLHNAFAYLVRGLAVPRFGVSPPAVGKAAFAAAAGGAGGGLWRWGGR